MLFTYLGNLYKFGKVDAGFFGEANCVVSSENKEYCLALDFKNIADRKEFCNRVHSKIKDTNVKILNIDDCLVDLTYDEIFCNLIENPSSYDSYFNVDFKEDKEIFLKLSDSISYFGNLTDLFNLEFNNKGELNFYTNSFLNLITVYDYNSDLWSDLKTDMMYHLVKNNRLVLDFGSKYFKTNAGKIRRSQDISNIFNLD